ncbi:MAG: hypothetical protein K6E71_00500 [Lachnospiraceae bacterium]|nr:hypothetical protein [Lachnospiraceae bacterium]
MMKKKETKPKGIWGYLLAAFATMCLAVASLYGGGYLNPEEKPFANAFHGEFQQYAEETFDTNHDGVFSKEELDAVEYIALPDLPENIRRATWNSQWLSCFPNLTTLRCSEWGISELSVRYNPKLAVLDCSKNLITDLDLSANPELVSVDCSKQGKVEAFDSYAPLMYEGLTNLVLGDNPKLRTLNLESNDVAVLNLTGAPNLQMLNCQENWLVLLNLSANTMLQELNCGGNRLEELDVSNLKDLVQLQCSSNGLKTIRFATDMNALTRIDCGCNSMKELDVHGLPELSELFCSEMFTLETLNISDCPKLMLVWCGSNPQLKISSEGCSKDIWIDIEASE